MADDLHDALHREIAGGALLPGERLVEEEIAERYGVGRTAVRTALVRLEHDGLVEHERNRGARVRLVTEEEALQILEARAALEGLAAREAARRATGEEIGQLRAIVADMGSLLDGGDVLAVSERNPELHRQILEISGHAVAQRICATLNSQLVRFQFRTILAPGRSGRSLHEHAAIVEAIAAHDGEAAEAAMRGHLANVAATLRTGA